MATQEVADKLVQLCREGKNLQAIDELYADNVISKEPKGSPVEVTEDKEAVKREPSSRTKAWQNCIVSIAQTRLFQIRILQSLWI